MRQALDKVSLKIETLTPQAPRGKNRQEDMHVLKECSVGDRVGKSAAGKSGEWRNGLQDVAGRTAHCGAELSHASRVRFQI